MATKIQGGGSASGIANVDSNFNLQVATTLSEELAGFVSLTAENDSGSITGTRYTLSPEVSNDFRLRTANDQTIFNELFPGVSINSTIWTAPTATATITVLGGFCNLNAASALGSGAAARLQTYRHFPCYKSYTTYFEMELNFTSLPVLGNVCEWGAGLSTGTTTPTDGAFFRINAVGEFRAVINNNGTETQSATLDFTTLVPINNTKSFLIYVCSNVAYFWIDNVLVAKVEAPAGQGTVTSSQNLPLFFRNYNSSATSTAQIMKIAMVNVTLADQTSNKSWPHVLAGAGAHNSQGQTGGTLGTTALYTNSLAAGAGAAMTNTTAALGSGLGGQFTTQPTLTAGTDGIVSSYQVPLGTAIYPGKSLYITRITVNSAVSASLTGGPVLYAYSLAYGHTAVSLATTETATSKAPRRLPIGMHSFAATAIAGTLAIGNVDLDLTAPIVVQPGEFVQIVAKNLGTVTSAGTITFIISFGGYWE